MDPDAWKAIESILPTLMKNGIPTEKIFKAAGIAPPFPDWMNAPIRPIQRAKLDDLQAKTAEQERWLEIVRAKDAARESREERLEREFQVLRKMQANEKRRAEAQAKFDLLEEKMRRAEKMAESQAARIAFGQPVSAPKPKKPAGPPILPLDTPRRFFED